MRQTPGSDIFSMCGQISESKLIGYSLGGLMYTPAHNEKVSDFLISQRYEHLRSLALCMEDAIVDGSEHEAVVQTARTFRNLENSVKNGKLSLNEIPYIFIRVKTAEQILPVFEAAGDTGILTGFIFPKFDETNAGDFLECISKINRYADNIIYSMPILESRSVFDIRSRIPVLSAIRAIIDSYSNNIINIRIGGNDFCSALGVRRRMCDSIYSIASVSSVIGDIVSIFSDDYIISAPVWDYFEGTDTSDTSWANGLANEIQLDIINGLTGKTAIHPSQLRIIDKSLSVSQNDFRDASDILKWKDDRLAVSKGTAGNRMNEIKVHRNWAEKIIIRAAVYGISE